MTFCMVPIFKQEHFVLCYKDLSLLFDSILDKLVLKMLAFIFSVMISLYSVKTLLVQLIYVDGAINNGTKKKH